LIQDAMSLRKSPTRTPALLEANRRNARKSTGPRTARGKTQTGMNAWRNGGRSRLRRHLWVTLLNAPPGRVEAWAKALMTTEMNLNPHMREVAEIIIQAERETGQYYHELASGQKRQ
jgi:epoxyqueuosine reductase QueG